MRRTTAFLALLLVCALASPASAARHGGTRPGGMVYAFGVGPQIDSPVEQETDWPFPADRAEWVVNPTGCAWDVDDHWMRFAQGTLGAGESLSVDECVIASPTSFYRTVNGQTAWWSQSAGFLGQVLRSPSPDLVVSMCFQPQGRCFTPAPVYDAANKAYLYRSCARAQYRPDEPILTTIPNSQGGIGLRQTVTVTVANPTGRTVRNLFSDVSAVGVVQIAFSGFTSGCPDQHSGLYVTDYPFTYYVS